VATVVAWIAGLVLAGALLFGVDNANAQGIVWPSGWGPPCGTTSRPDNPYAFPPSSATAATSWDLATTARYVWANCQATHAAVTGLRDGGDGGPSLKDTWWIGPTPVPLATVDTCTIATGVQTCKPGQLLFDLHQDADVVRQDLAAAKTSIDQLRDRVVDLRSDLAHQEGDTTHRAGDLLWQIKQELAADDGPGPPSSTPTTVTIDGFDPAHFGDQAESVANDLNQVLWFLCGCLVALLAGHTLLRQVLPR
jgi:hypothetical protein